MIAGIALYLKKINPKIRIIGIQSELVAPLIEFKRTESLRYITPTTTIADGVNVLFFPIFLTRQGSCSWRSSFQDFARASG